MRFPSFTSATATLLPLVALLFASGVQAGDEPTADELALVKQWNAGNYSSGWVSVCTASKLLTQEVLEGLENYHRNFDWDKEFGKTPRNESAVAEAIKVRRLHL
jgi:lipocalin